MIISFFQILRVDIFDVKVPPIRGQYVLTNRDAHQCSDYILFVGFLLGSPWVEILFLEVNELYLGGPTFVD